MITNTQLQALAKTYQIDTASILKEYIQLMLLNKLYQYHVSKDIFFKGGTAIHLIYQSSRFSEDLDFSTKLSFATTATIVKKLQQDISSELDITIPLLYKGKETVRYKVRFRHDLMKYPLTVKMDFNKSTLLTPFETTVLATDFPIVVIPAIVHMSAKEIVLEKIQAIVTRNKGRDLYDLWFMLRKKTLTDMELVIAKAASLSKKCNKKILTERIKLFPQKDLESDLKPFLPRSQRKLIPNLKQLLLDELVR